MKFLSLIGVIALMWLVGLFVFADRVRGYTPAAEPERADAIVALTGPSAERVNAAIRLLEQDKGRRVLVSGVNREASREDIRTVSRAVRRLYDCCVDLGFTAADTVGNARETLAWARAMRYRSLIIVTADYHMPRAMLELRGAMPDKRLTPYPVATSVMNAGRWWRTSGAARLMVTEYCKYLAILGREAVLGLGPRNDAPKKG